MIHLGGKSRVISPGKNFILNPIMAGGIALSNRLMRKMTHKLNKAYNKEFGKKPFDCWATGGGLWFRQQLKDASSSNVLQLHIRNKVAQELRDEMSI